MKQGYLILLFWTLISAKEFTHYENDNIAANLPSNERNKFGSIVSESPNMTDYSIKG